ncbi:MAG TPA: hypothetical protein VKU41_16270 [Polyangiaceae bacterium]|nr:hypothetical protein [Polyangiaceae bacterium]
MASPAARASNWALRAAFALVVVCALGCDASLAFPVPSGPPRTVALDVRLPLYGLGRWVVDGFTQTLVLELGRYNVRVVDRAAGPDAVARVDLGQFTYRQWEEVDVLLLRGGRQVAEPDRIRVPDLEPSTLDVAAELVAGVVARRLWQPG